VRPRAALARCLITVWLTAAPLPAQDPPLWGGLKPGSYAVGYRGAAVGAATLHVWFPARAQRGEPLPVGRYLGAAGNALPARLLEARTAAFLDAPPASGPFPLVLYAGDPEVDEPDNTVLMEYLASHGYVVVAMGSGVDHLEAARAAVSGFSYVRRDTVGIVARKGGWVSAVEFAAREPAVRAILALDPPRGGPAAGAPGRRLAVLRLRADGSVGNRHSQAPPPGTSGPALTVPGSTAGSFTDRAAVADFLDQPGRIAPDHRRLIGSVTHAFLDGALRAWGPSLEDLVERLSRAGLEITR
jgi:hypothetical protein